MENFIQLADAPNLSDLLQQAAILKQHNQHPELGKGKTLGMLFFNPSLRTRLSTEKAAKLLGMEVITMNLNSDSWALEFEDGAVMDSNKAEHIKEAAGVLSQYCDVIAVRAFPGLQDKVKDEEEQVLSSFKKYSSVPVLNLESATAHPLQALADAITVLELSQKTKPKIVLSWAPHPKALPQSVPNSFVDIMRKIDVELIITNPPGYDLDPRIRKDIPVTHNQESALEKADFVYVKNWSSYEDYGKVLPTDTSWTFSMDKWSLTNMAKVMHCLPVRRNVVIADEVLDSEHAVVMEQANNRTFAAQAVLKNLLTP